VSTVLWSVTVQAAGDRPMTHDEILELADAVAPAKGIASGIGTEAYGAQLVVEAADRETAIGLGRALFAEAAAIAGLPDWPVSAVDAISEDEDLDGLEVE
jgi:hypothetical protein